MFSNCLVPGLAYRQRLRAIYLCSGPSMCRPRDTASRRSLEPHLFRQLSCGQVCRGQDDPWDVDEECKCSIQTSTFLSWMRLRTCSPISRLRTAQNRIYRKITGKLSRIFHFRPLKLKCVWMKLLIFSEAGSDDFPRKFFCSTWFYSWTLVWL